MFALTALSEFEKGYLECALWSSTNDDGIPLDSLYDLSSFAPETLVRMRADCASFSRDCAEMFEGDEERAGHDFWLTRNGHGAGFWDGDWPVGGDTLTDIAHAYPEVCLYVGDDGYLYQM